MKKVHTMKPQQINNINVTYSTAELQTVTAVCKSLSADKILISNA